jgi:hypothetical protein
LLRFWVNSKFNKGAQSLMFIELAGFWCGVIQDALFALVLLFLIQKKTKNILL